MNFTLNNKVFLKKCLRYLNIFNFSKVWTLLQMMRAKHLKSNIVFLENYDVLHEMKMLLVLSSSSSSSKNTNTNFCTKKLRTQQFWPVFDRFYSKVDEFFYHTIPTSYSYWGLASSYHLLYLLLVTPSFNVYCFEIGKIVQ